MHIFKKMNSAAEFIKNHYAEKKLNAEIPKLIDSLMAYLNAGLHPYQAIEISSQKAVFSKNLRFHLFKIATLCTRGSSFVEAIDAVLKHIIFKPSHKYFALLLIGLKISFLKGANSNKILEKIREKSLDEIQFQRKLRVITAQMRLQSNVILFSPLFLCFVLLIISPGHVFIFFDSFFGNCLLALMVVFNLCGYFSLRRIMRVE